MSIADKLKTISSNVQKVYNAGYEEGVKVDPQWNAYCLKTGEHFDLPEGMWEIPTSMFEGHINLKTISIPTTVREIGYEAFRRSGVRIGQLPESLDTVRASAFSECQNNDVVVFSPSISMVVSQAFRNNANLTEVTFVETSKESGKPGSMDLSVFDDCPNLTTINVPWSEDDLFNEDAPWGAENATINYNFWDTARNSEVFTFPPGFVKIPDYLFYDTTATNAKEIYLGDECKEIGACAFYKAKNLETVHLPEGLTTIGEYAFRYSTALKLSELPDSVETIGKTAFQGSNISLSKLPKNIKELGVNCFYNCKNNNFTEIPEGVTLIASQAFANNTGLTKLTFLGSVETPKIVKGIANNAFSGCTNLVEINVPWSEGQVSGAPWGAVNATINYGVKTAQVKSIELTSVEPEIVWDGYWIKSSVDGMIATIYFDYNESAPLIAEVYFKGIITYTDGYEEEFITTIYDGYFVENKTYNFNTTIYCNYIEQNKDITITIKPIRSFIDEDEEEL